MQHGIKSLNYLIGHILYQIFNIILNREKTDNPSRRICLNKLEHRIAFEIKTTFYLELLTPEITKIFGYNKIKTTKDKNGENVPHLEITEAVLVHCNIVNNDYEQDSRALHTFLPKKSLGQLLNISPKNFEFLKSFDSEFLYIEVWSTDQNPKPLEIEDRINITLVIN